MIQQVEFSLREKRRGFHLVTGEILQHLPQPLPETGLLNLFVKHTSCSLSINENADPDVRTDMEQIFNHLVKEREPYYDHVLERPSVQIPSCLLLSARIMMPADEMTFVIPAIRLPKMLSTMKDTCLFDTPAWSKIKQRIERP